MTYKCRITFPRLLCTSTDFLSFDASWFVPSLYQKGPFKSPKALNTHQIVCSGLYRRSEGQEKPIGFKGLLKACPLIRCHPEQRQHGYFGNQKSRRCPEGRD